MPDEAKSSKPVPKQMKRFSIGANVFIQIVLVIVLFGFANYLSYRHYRRLDLTPSRDYSLSETTENYLKKVAKDINITIVFARESPIMGDIRAMVDEFRRAKRSRIHVDELDPIRDVERAEQLKLENEITLTGNGILVSANKRSRFITEEEIIIKGLEGGRANPSTDFRGEDALTSAIINLMEGKVRRFHYVIGKGTASGKSGDLSFLTLADLGRRQNFEVAPINLADSDRIPEGADGVIIVGPRYDFSAKEIKQLTDYWEDKRAAMLVMLDPNGETPNLRRFLQGNGVLPRADRVLYAESTSAGPKVQFSVQTTFSQDSPISKPFAEVASSLSGQTQSLELRPGAPEVRQQHIEITALMDADERFWGENRYLQQLPVVDPEDTKPPVHIAASIERGHVSDERLRVDSSRMIVIGNALMLEPATRLAVHQDFISAALNWMMNRERLSGITPKRKQTFRIELSDLQRKRIFWTTGLLMPLCVLMLGFLVWSHRRS
jgi:ABC-type uncharacterized transport system